MDGLQIATALVSGFGGFIIGYAWRVAQENDARRKGRP